MVLHRVLGVCVSANGRHVFRGGFFCRWRLDMCAGLLMVSLSLGMIVLSCMCVYSANMHCISAAQELKVVLLLHCIPLKDPSHSVLSETVVPDELSRVRV
jgi:hypothetical protein